MKHRIGTLKKLQKSMQSLCDDDSNSSEDIRPSFLKSLNLVSKSSDEDISDEENKKDNDKQKMNKEHLKSDKYRNNMKNKKVIHNDLKNDKSKNKKSSSSSDSEDEISKKHAKKREKKSVTLKSKQEDFINLYKQEADSSSGKEFQLSKIANTGSKVIKKLTQIKEDCIVSADSNSGSTIQIGEKTVIDKEQSLVFKSGVIKILNKFKDVCSEYELEMEHVKWKHFKKELVYKESANNIIQKTRNVINNFRMELNAQEKELTNFYEQWNKNCKLQNTDHEDSSSSESEVFKNIKNTEKSDKSKDSSNAASVVSECDSDEIFSNNEITTVKANVDSKKKNEDLTIAKVSEKSMDTNDENNSDIASPILIGNKQKRIGSKMNAEDNSEINDKTKVLKDCQISETEHIMNKSVDDIFEENITENINNFKSLKKNKDECNKDNLKSKQITENNHNKNKNSSKNEEMNIEVESKDPCISSEEVLEPTKVGGNNVSDEVAEEEQARRTMLESDSETPPYEESLIESSSTKESSKNNSSKISQSEKKSHKKEKIQSNSIPEGSSSEEQDQIKEACAKHTLLESNSDDSMSPSDTRKSSDKKQDSDDNSEDSSFDNDDKLQVIKRTNVSSDENKKKDKRADFIQQAHLHEVNYAGSDEKLKMYSEVAVERLSEKILEKYNDAIQKSRQYLESKEVNSLLNLDRLNKNRKNINDLVRSPLPRSAKRAKTKETEDSLLDHLKKVEDGEFEENKEEDHATENDNLVAQIENSLKTNESLMIEADAATKNILLHSSDSDVDEQKIASENSEEEKSNAKSKDSSKKSNEKAENKGSDEENDEESEKNKWRRNKLLTMKFSSDSDSDTAREKWNKKQEKLIGKEEENNTDNLVIKDEVVKRKRRNRRKIVDSDSDVQLLTSDTESNNFMTLENNKSSDSDSSVGKQKRRKRKAYKSSDTDSSHIENRSKPKRKRIKNVSNDSDESSDADQTPNSQGTPGKKGRKNIRKVMKDKQVADDTKLAAKEEEERLKRIAERQKLYNEMYEARLAGEEKVDKLVLDFNPETKEELVTVHENLVKRLKPHQAKGIKFMWDACFESLERVKSSTGSGCIIAHCMGLGKTLQVIVLIHTLLTHSEIGVRTIMIVCPLSTVLNWKNEFSLWLKNIEDNDIDIYEMTKLKKNIERKYQLECWQRTGGVLIIGYEMFRNLSGTNNKMRKNMKEAVLKCLIDPGPDVIVCDEGHLLKNEDTALSKSITRIKTLRRIVLTGTPLQNNLIEYHCMVQFVKPNLLGTKKEFLNRFANPITNGQFDDSTEYDVKLMKKRAYVLHKMLKGCVQRFDYSVLTPFLPPKQEYVIFISLTEVQINMYRYYLENFARGARNANGVLFADFQALQRIWTHPLVLQWNTDKINEKKLDSSDSETSLKDFIDDSETESDSSSTVDDDDSVQSDSNSSKKNVESNSANDKPEVEVIQKPEENENNDHEWWLQFTQSEHFEDMRVSAKLMLLFGILKECEQIGDKVLVFSQSLYSLTLIEHFLEKIDNETQNGTKSEYVDGHSGRWSLGLDYFRLDGQTSAENRSLWCKIFNRPSNTRARLFLISTRAGGLGINLTAANRVIIFDASWNPSHDVQSIFRVYRFGQKKPCYVYRFLATGTMEEKIYNRQVTKLSLSCRVVDKQQIERHYSNHNLSELYKFEPNTNKEKSTLNLPKDRLLAEIFLKYKDYVENYHEHDSLLENKAEEELNEEERKQAWLEYEEEKKGKRPVPSYSNVATFQNYMLNQYNMPSTFNISTDYKNLQELLQKDYPNASPETQQMMTTRVLTDMYSYWEQQAYHNAANRILNQNVGVQPVQMRTQVPNLARMNYVVQNTNNTISNQPKNYPIRVEDPDDDVVEVTSSTVTSSTVSNKNKNQEE